MKSNSRLKPFAALAICAIAVPLLASACNSDNPLASAADALCCKQFVVGADLSTADFKLSGQLDGKFRAFAQAGSDLGALASASLTDVSVACESIARDVGASDTDIAKVDTMTGDPTAKLNAWCTLAAATIKASFSATGKFKAKATLDFQPPTCKASVSAQASCEAKCTVDGKCDASAMLECEGGKLPTVDCTGKCEATAMVPEVSCSGTCSAQCTGGCTAAANATIDCEGKCDGACTVDGTAASGSGVQADGTCKGKCDGTCTATGGVMAKCDGTCSGTCKGTCEATSGSAKFECNGSCTATAGTPPRCEGSAKLDCKVDADCEGSCSASVKAKAECTPPKVAVVLSASADLDVDAKAQLNVALASLETNLPQLLVVVQARGASFTAGLEAAVSAGVSLTGDAPKFSAEAAICIPPVVAAVASASANFAATLKAAASVTASVGS